MKQLFGEQVREETVLSISLVVIMALVLQNLLLVLTLTHLSSPDLVVVFRALTRVAILVLTGPVTL